MKLAKLWASFKQSRVPIFADLSSACWPNWREALKEIFVILFFSLMPLWLGLLIVNLPTITDGASGLYNEVCFEFGPRHFKVFTNYRYVLISAGVLVDGKMQAAELETPWPYEAIQLFWDRQVFCGELHRASGPDEFEAAFFRNDVHKLIGCTAKQGRAYALRAYRDYSARWLPQRMEHLEELRGRLAA
jgi:hypothetical protein